VPQGRVVAPRGRTVIVGRSYPYYYRPYYSYFYADPFWYGYPWFGAGYAYGYGAYGYQYPIGPYGYGAYRYAERDSAVRFDVEPNNAEVFVDGYYAGIVDDFDGVFQRLRVPPGQHEITLYLDGYKTAHQQVYLTVDSTFRIRFNMERLAAGDVAEPRPTPPNPPPGAEAGPGQPGQPGPPNPPPPPPGRDGRRNPPPFPPPPGQGAPRGGQASNYGTLSIRVQPGDATVIIDGERWNAPQGQDRLVVEVAEGGHRVQIQKDGFESYSADVTVRRGEATPLNVSLRNR